MKKDKFKDYDKDDNMINAGVMPTSLSLADFIKKNRTKINSITPKNPCIKKDDEWRKEDFWDDICEEKKGE